MISFLIAIGIVAILFLTRKWTLPLNPIRWFSYIWCIQLVIALLAQDFLKLTFTGLAYIEICVVCALLGCLAASRVYRVAPVSALEYTPDQKHVKLILYVVLALSILNPIMFFYQNGFSLAVLLNMEELLDANNTIASERYNNPQSKSTLLQLLLVFTYAAPLYGGYVKSILKKRVWLSYLTILPGILTAITQAVKMNLISSVFLWIAGFMTYKCFSRAKKEKLKLKTLLKLGGVGLAFFGILFFSMVLRTGKITANTTDTISRKFVGYAIGQLPVFDQWFDEHNEPAYTYGGMTFAGIANPLGLVKRVQGLYQETYVTTKDNQSSSNIYTLYRVFIDDWGYAGTLLAFFLLGMVATANTCFVSRRQMPCITQSVQMALWALVLWSFATSFFAYTSYIAVFIVISFILKYSYEPPKLPSVEVAA